MKTKLLGIILIITVLAAFTACDDSDPAHTHDFSGAWQKNATHHWKVCAADGAEDQKAAHAPADGVCTTCQYDNTPQPVHCPDTDNDGNGHLGVGENCIKDTGDCTGLQNYKPTEGKYSSFPYDIYRVGALTESNYPGTELMDTVNGIVGVYFGDRTVDLGEGEIYDVDNDDRMDLQSRPLKTMYVLDANSSNTYTLNQAKTILGIRVSTTDYSLISRFKGVAGGSLNSNVALLQPASNIRLASGKKRTEQFPVIAGGADGKLPRANRLGDRHHFCLVSLTA